jgi:dethiobiotin synthetase
MEYYVVAGIGTDAGKTVASAVLAQTFSAAYWKPVQTGDASSADSLSLRKLCPEIPIVPEAYHFPEPASPHYAASLTGEEIDMVNLGLPFAGPDRMIIELAGGIMVPLNDAGYLNADLLESWKLPVFVVTTHYLGSINHTLLTLSELVRRNIRIAGLIVNGDTHEPSERIYKKLYPGITFLRLPKLEPLDAASVAKTAETWKKIIG